MEKAGYGAASHTNDASGQSKETSGESKSVEQEQYKAMKKRLVYSLVFTIPLFYISMGHMLGWPLPAGLLGMENAAIILVMEI